LTAATALVHAMTLVSRARGAATWLDVPVLNLRED
jgi:hypothetical protein